MTKIAEEFLVKADEKAFDLDHRDTINHNIGKYNAAVERGLTKFENLELKKEGPYDQMESNGEPRQILTRI